MKTTVLTIIVCLLVSVPSVILAQPYHYLDDIRQGLWGQFRLFDLPKNIVPVALMGDHDHRQPISKVYKSIGLSEAEYHQAQVSTGVIHCKDAAGKFHYAGGVIAESKNVLIANTHAFLDHDGTMEKGCYFANYANPADFYQISAQDIAMGNTAENRMVAEGDYAVVRLKKEVNEAIPYHLDWNGTSFEVGDKLITISSTHNPNSPKLIGSEPKIQSCSVLQTYPLDAQGRNSYKTTCDGLRGDSGALNLTRAIDGKLVLRGIHVGEAPSSKPQCVPNQQDCASVSVQLVGPALMAVKRLMALSGQPVKASMPVVSQPAINEDRPRIAEPDTPGTPAYRSKLNEIVNSSRQNHE